MPCFRVYAEWTVAGWVDVEAEDMEEAAIAAEDLDLEAFGAEYVDDSFAINWDCTERIS